MRPTPALIVAGTHSGSGKTTVTLAILAALVRRGVRVQAFKVGPDFIDPGHQSHVTGRPSRNLDTWLLDPRALGRTYRNGVAGAELAIIEGVMGLFDGRGGCDDAGSTASLARLWRLPVVLTVDARGLARSIAPLVLGFARFDPTVEVAGAIANKVGSHRHFSEYLAPALRAADLSIEPLGFLPRDESLVIPSRHLGLLLAGEAGNNPRLLDALADAAEATLDLDRIVAMARPPALPEEAKQSGEPPGPDRVRPTRVGLARDRAFCFYYEDNLDALRSAGAELVPFSPLDDTELPGGLGLIYLGGGYPELHGERLAANGAMREAIRRFHAEGGSILAECGGLMACTESIRDHQGRDHRLWGLVPARTVMQDRFAALGYVTVRSDRPSLLGPPGTSLRGHEFHYSRLEPRGPLPYATALLRPDRDPTPDGIQIGGLHAGYAHLHFGSNPHVAGQILQGMTR